MKTKLNPTLLFEIERAGLPSSEAHWSLDDYEGEAREPSSKLYYVEGLMEGFVLYRDAVGDIEVMNLAVRNKGRGFGRRLLTSFLESLGVDFQGQIFLELRASNHAARKLYEALGFKKNGERRAYYKNGEDALVYALDKRRPL